jgi:poly(beta-D-mannuronate) lyase
MDGNRNESMIRLYGEVKKNGRKHFPLNRCVHPGKNKALLNHFSRIVLFAFLVNWVFAGEVHVSSVPALQTAVDNASLGDTLVLANGMYLNTSLTISTNSITVRAETPGGVFLNGQQSIDIYGNDVTFSGFQFTSGNIGDAYLIDVYGSRNLIKQLNINGYSAKKYIAIHSPGQYNRVMFCNFENKPVTASIGNLVHIDPDSLKPGYHTISHCSFKNMPGAGGDNGNECIRISNGATSTFVSRTVVEFCYFMNTGLGDGEAISVKCRENVLRYNTFTNNPNAMMVFRNGDNNIAYGNFFINSGGIRVKEANNIYCYNNYFENAGVGGSSEAVSYNFVSPNLKNINFLFNTFVNCGDIDLGSGATNNTWANNLFKKSGTIFSGSPSGISWAGNMYQGTLGMSIPSGMNAADPLLVLNPEGYYGISSGSPAVNSASSSFPAIMDIANVDDDPALLLDISGQPRPVPMNEKDAGCDEFTSGPIKNHPLKLTDVGPSYLGGPSTGIFGTNSGKGKESFSLTPELSDCYPNPFNPVTTIQFRMPVPGKISLKIFDQLGREEVTLVDGMMTSGEHRIHWNGAEFASGMHYIRLQSNTWVETKKVLLLK